MRDIALYGTFHIWKRMCETGGAKVSGGIRRIIVRFLSACEPAESYIGVRRGFFFFFCDSEMTDEDREIVFNTQAEHTPSWNSKTSSLVDFMVSARQELQNTKPIPMMPPLYVKTLGGCQLHSGRRHSKLLRRCMH